MSKVSWAIRKIFVLGTEVNTWVAGVAVKNSMPEAIEFTLIPTCYKI